MSSDINTPPAVLVTGASTGIGRACAVHLAGLGYRVYGGVRRSQDAIDLSRAHASITPILLDVTNPMQIQNAVDQITRELGGAPFMGLVNNAGVAIAGPLEFVPVGELRRQLEINVIGLVAVTQAFLPLLRKAQGRIVHIGSIAGKLAAPFNGPYAASKHAVEAISDSMRRELRGTGVEVCLIEPGAVSTPIWDKSSGHAERMLEGMPPEATEYYGKAFGALRAMVQGAAKRAHPPEVVARAVEHALTADTPKTRYRCGSGAHTEYFLSRVLPDRLLDWVIARIMGLK